MAYYDYADPAIAIQAFPVILSVIGAFILLISLPAAHAMAASTTRPEALGSRVNPKHT
jgi:cytochrome c oxidase subunit 1